MPGLWAIFTVMAAAGQVLRNVQQKELTQLLGTVGATHVRFAAADSPYASCVPLHQARDGWFALELEGESLPAMHGGPVRWLQPAYLWGYKGVKWVCSMTVLDRLDAGPWETKVGDVAGSVPEGLLDRFEDLEEADHVQEIEHRGLRLDDDHVPARLLALEPHVHQEVHADAGDVGHPPKVEDDAESPAVDELAHRVEELLEGVGVQGADQGDLGAMVPLRLHLD